MVQFRNGRGAAPTVVVSRRRKETRMTWSRRELVKAGAFAAVGSAIGPGMLQAAVPAAAGARDLIEQWGLFEASFHSPVDAHPFLDVDFGATFQHLGRTIDVDGFYDGAAISGCGLCLTRLAHGLIQREAINQA